MTDEPTLDGATPGPSIEYTPTDPEEVPASPPVEPDADGNRTLTQSFKVSCTVVLDAQGQPARDAEGNPMEPVFQFEPNGDNITMDDCIALATRGIQWMLGARARVAAQQMQQMQEQARQRDLKRILTPAEAASMAPLSPGPTSREALRQRRIIRPQ